MIAAWLCLLHVDNGGGGGLLSFQGLYCAVRYTVHHCGLAQAILFGYVEQPQLK